ncbi:MAG TPA: PhaM family polyhydroxyalkanoate granule multifunctional regulatory protein [Caldimonas sp.]|jgi:hypothetical protein|nr:PhaM family polyhydroxyalkanoate granule multifunctional regulatory protein [Caldimonas sp.]HEX2539644.1 PhaM family polyhydroxyalkanoate granule multifunctional regulatory protein [Caldimonas sp.]
MNDGSGFAKMVPGFDFLQSLVKNAGSAIPGIGQWVAPTLDPAELEKRIGDLRTVQFWLEQNARMLATTIQALEVQRMTLSTLKTMNVQMEDLRDSLKIKPDAGAGAASASAPADDRKKTKAGGGQATGAAAAVDPMQWWGALTSQFAQLAASAMKDSASGAAKVMAGSLAGQSSDAAKAMAGDIVKQSFDAATAPARAVMDAVGKKRSQKAPRAGDTAQRPAAKKAAARRRRAPAAGTETS